jgi:hypothetical protein
MTKFQIAITPHGNSLSKNGMQILNPHLKSFNLTYSLLQLARTSKVPSLVSPKLGVVWRFLFIYEFLIEISTNPYILGPNKTNPQQLGIFKRFVFQQIQSFAWLHEKSHLPWNPIYWTNHNFAWSSRQTDTMDDGDRRDPFMLKN